RLVGPFGAFVDPLLERRDVLRRQRTGRRHLDAELRADETLIEAAAFGVAGADIGLRAAAHRVGTPIETEAVHLLLGTVAAQAMLAEDRLHVAAEVDLASGLGAQKGRGRQDETEGERPRRTHGGSS